MAKIMKIKSHCMPVLLSGAVVKPNTVVTATLHHIGICIVFIDSKSIQT